MTATAFATLVLRVDAVANAALAAGVLALLAPLAHAVGLASAWPLVAVAILLLANAMLCWRAARGGRPTSRVLHGLAAVDVGFAVAVLWFALADPIGTATWLRVVLGGLLIVVFAVATSKLLLAYRLAPGRAATLQR